MRQNPVPVPLVADSSAGKNTTLPELPAQAGVVLGHVAGYVGFHTLAMGLRKGLVAALAQAPEGLDAARLAKATRQDPFYVSVWCQSAVAASVVDVGPGGTYRLAPHMATLLLDEASPAYAGGMFDVLGQPEMFQEFEASLADGDRTWWDKVSPVFIQGVSRTGGPFYTRLVPAGFDKVPGLAAKLHGGAKVLELAVGAGKGLERMATTYPKCTFTGIDGDDHSMKLTEERLAKVGVGDRIRLERSPLEDIAFDGEFDVAVINISMHECRDLDKVAANVHRALKPGGVFVISDFPYPTTVEALRTAPGRIMSGIQFFEARIDDQLLPTTAFLELLKKHRFQEVGAFDLTPTHAVTHGRK